MLKHLFRQKWNSTQLLKVTMLGHTGVGKTSLLAAIYDQFDKIIGQTNLQLTPDEDTKTTLDNRLKELKRMAAGDPNNPNYSIKVREGLRKSQEPISYCFSLGRTGFSPVMELEFQDYPGKFLEEKAEIVENFMRESVAILIAIDSPALMERNGFYHDEFNIPDTIYNLFKKTYKNLETPKLVILAPVKCEKYLQNKEKEQELLETVQKKYNNLINFFRSDALSAKVAVVITPVQTLGSVRCHAIELDENNEPIFCLSKFNGMAMYEPKDCDQPLRYLLRFLLRLYLEQKQKGIFKFLFKLFGQDTAFRDAVIEFANGCRNDSTFVVVQGSNLLKLKDY